mmetsp:Transcript_45864/g.109209  ORF Transcript_45864/g.109209 Transcript_45864/m.109209 type:complete len:272 (+) Transcript_45864:66-881(+)|eukprot:CAMPEP_0178406478 /NCGR_PEP_ID=MMETSP0689_2-20121128/18932_1 /TAXON_ID=160604 /ORGANISM="Amphidinium massartii, Strain CS-259" /LENGTH=271 /DNA_ID=CAMNT_0020027519 /DNA_START=14 /DNA_END=829 /DNA_ORIENTATION=+
MANSAVAPARTSPGRRRATCLLRWVVCLGTGYALVRFVVFPLLFWRAAEKCERPAHEVMLSMEIPDVETGKPLQVELRRYEPYLVAEVTLPHDLSEKERRSSGFRQVAGYIFGKNGRRRGGLFGQSWMPARIAATKEVEKIAMTAPVRSETVGKSSASEVEDGDADTAVISFTMPSKYKAVKDLPIPENRNVTLKEVPEHYAAVVGFRGPPPTPERVLLVKQAILRCLEENDLEPVKDRGAMVYQYHDPFATPNLLRWNEVVVMINKPTDE